MKIGLDEAVFCESKTVDQISAILDAVRAKTGRMLLTRLDPSKSEALMARQSGDLDYNSLSRTAILGDPHPTLAMAPAAIVMAGTSDLPVGREAARTLAFAGQPYREYSRYRRRRPLASPRTHRGYSVRSRRNRRRGHGRGPRQRRGRPRVRAR